MKKYIALILVLLMMTASLFGCADKGNVSDTDNGVVTDNVGEDTKDDTKDKVDNTASPMPTEQEPEHTAVPGTQAVTP